VQPTDIEYELMHQLSAVGASCVQQGLTLASGGNLSAREPDSDRFVVTGSGVWLDGLSPESFALVSTDGQHLWGTRQPSSEWKLHQRTYVQRRDVNAMVHAHPQHAVLLDILGKPIRLLTLDHAHYVHSIGRVGFFPNGSDELADGAAQQGREHNVVILAHHGCSTLGHDVNMAFRRAMLLEEAAITTYRALLLGDENTTFSLTGQAGRHA